MPDVTLRTLELAPDVPHNVLGVTITVGLSDDSEGQAKTDVDLDDPNAIQDALDAISAAESWTIL